MPHHADPTPLLIAGPTASGKSAYALDAALRTPSVIINADSMQVYEDLALITARPSRQDEARAPHALFGHADGAVAYSTGDYIRDLAPVLAAAKAEGLRPIIAGGTGLYFKALLEGLSPVPAIPGDVRAYWREQAGGIGAAALHRELVRRDPVMAERLRPSDPQRVTRALEVLEATGVSLAVWQKKPGTPLLDETACERVVILPEREALYGRADARFEAMMAAGALDEVAALRARRLAPDLPVMRALGVPELCAHLAGEMVLETAVAQAKLQTRRYIKRQLTWLKRNMSTWKTIETK